VILEAPADFTRELSIIAARGRDGAIAVYPLAENHHEAASCAQPRAGPVFPKMADEAERIAARILGGLNYVGVIGIELFELRDGRPAGQRDRAQGAQHRPLDAGRLRGRPVRAAHPRLSPLAAGAHGADRAGEMLNLLGDEAEGWAGSRTNRRPACTSTASAKPSPAARWATSTS
jgi:5-(carboxyamino)imidazole ribonucleotide synthase